MKYIKYIICVLIMLFSDVFYVNASCTDTELKELNSLAKDIRIIYKHKGIVETEERTLYNQFDVTVKNINKDLYISLLGNTIKLTPDNNGVATTELNNGTWYFNVYSTKCNVLVDEIKVFIPTFNLFSLDPLCEGIDGDEFPLCGKYYEYDVSYNEFEEEVIAFREKNKLENKNDNSKFDFKLLFKKIVDVVFEYKIYFISSLIVLLIAIILIININKKKNRGVLK